MFCRARYEVAFPHVVGSHVYTWTKHLRFGLVWGKRILRRGKRNGIRGKRRREREREREEDMKLMSGDEIETASCT